MKTTKARDTTIRNWNVDELLNSAQLELRLRHDIRHVHHHIRQLVHHLQYRDNEKIGPELHGTLQNPLLWSPRLGHADRPPPAQLRHVTVLVQDGEELRAGGLRRLLAPWRDVQLALLSPGPGGCRLAPWSAVRVVLHRGQDHLQRELLMPPVLP